MPMLNLQKYLPFLFLALCGFACSHIGLQLKKEGTASGPIPECRRNYIREGGLISRPVHRTWVKYDHLDFNRGFDLAVKALQSHGH